MTGRELELQREKERLSLINARELKKAQEEAIEKMTPYLEHLAQLGYIIYIQKGMEEYASELGYKKFETSAWHFVEDAYLEKVTEYEENALGMKKVTSEYHQIQHTKETKEYKLIVYAKAISPDQETHVRQLENKLFSEKQFLKIAKNGPVPPAPPPESKAQGKAPFILQNLMGRLLLLLMLATLVFSSVFEREMLYADGYLIKLIFEQDGVNFIADNRIVVTYTICAMFPVAMIGLLANKKSKTKCFSFAFYVYIVFAVWFLLNHLINEQAGSFEDLMLLSFPCRIAFYVCFIIGTIKGFIAYKNNDEYYENVQRANEVYDEWVSDRAFVQTPQYAELEKAHKELRTLSRT